MSNNINLHNAYYRYKYMLLGAKTLTDSHNIIEKLYLDNEQKKLLLNYVNCRKYDKCFSLIEMSDNIKKLNYM